MTVPEDVLPGVAQAVGVPVLVVLLQNGLPCLQGLELLNEPGDAALHAPQLVLVLVHVVDQHSHLLLG